MSDWVQLGPDLMARAEGLEVLVKDCAAGDVIGITRDQLQALLAMLPPDPLDGGGDDPDDGSSLRA